MVFDPAVEAGGRVGAGVGRAGGPGGRGAGGRNPANGEGALEEDWEWGVESDPDAVVLPRDFLTGLKFILEGSSSWSMLKPMFKEQCVSRSLAFRSALSSGEAKAAR